MMNARSLKDKSARFLELMKLYLSILTKRCITVPNALIFYVTFRCNLRCLHCNIQQLQFKEEISFAGVKDLFHELRSLGVREIRYSGGEPLLRKDLADILKMGKELGFRQYISTNGTLINRRVAKLLASTCDGVDVSIDGLKQNDRIRGLGSFERALSAIKLLNHYRQGLASIAFTLMKLNFMELPALCQLAEHLGCGISIQPIILGGAVFPSVDVENDELSFTKTDIRRL
ncbi:MAG: radical SAM protein [Candidatus Nezhaarchaeota archaeon]|nr:radical SAM protein [Candidatus Nezhaarchaeota archaeon]